MYSRNKQSRHRRPGSGNSLQISCEPAPRVEEGNHALTETGPPSRRGPIGCSRAYTQLGNQCQRGSTSSSPNRFIVSCREDQMRVLRHSAPSLLRNIQILQPPSFSSFDQTAAKCMSDLSNCVRNEVSRELIKWQTIIDVESNIVVPTNHPDVF